MPSLRPLALLASFCIAALALTGCGTGPLAPATPAASTQALHITGTVYGGQQPVAGAHIHVFQATYAGYNSSFDLIAATPGVRPAQDSAGFYVPSDSKGNFSITGDYLCKGTGPVYVLATQGNPGLPAAGSNNSALALLAVLSDSCSGSGGALSSSLAVNLNEITTVAGVYALAGYLSAPNTLTYPDNSLTIPQGLTNAADTALALVNLAQGSVNATTAAGGTVPAAAMTSLANILSACVNSNGTGAPCSTLFANSTADGTPTGTQPTDTVAALINIAHHPAANVAALYNLVTANPAFGGGLTAAPNDWTLAVGYSTVRINLVSPGIPAIDAAGRIWIGSTVPILFAGNVPIYNLFELSPTGSILATSFLFAQPIQAAIDPSGNAWFATSSGGQVYKIPSGSNLATGYSFNGTSKDDGHQIAIDTSGDVFISDYTTPRLIEIGNSGNAIGQNNTFYASESNNVALQTNTVVLTNDHNAALVAFSAPLNSSADEVYGVDNTIYSGITAIAVDAGQNDWALGQNDLVLNTHAGGAPTSYTGGGLNTAHSTNQPYPWLAIDGGNNIWTANYTGSLSEFNNSGAALTPAATTSAAQPGGFFGSTPSCKGQGLAIDGSGNIWVGCDNSAGGGSPYPVLEYIGAAVPVATPLLPGNFGVKP